MLDRCALCATVQLIESQVNEAELPGSLLNVMAHQIRQIVLDTETTGMDPAAGHRIIEIGCVEVVDRQVTKKHFHVYLNPDRLVDEGAIQVHGITNEFLVDKQRFGEIAQSFIEFVAGTELLIHNAAFDVGFINHELERLAENGGPDLGPIERHCRVTDTLKLAREKHPGQRNSLDALCRRYEVDNTGRTLHGALLDSQLLAEVYLALTGGQLTMDLAAPALGGGDSEPGQTQLNQWEPPQTRILRANSEELDAHASRLAQIKNKTGNCLWADIELPS